MAKKIIKYVFEDQSEDLDYLFSFDSDVMTSEDVGKTIDSVVKQILDEMDESHPDCVFYDGLDQLYAALEAAGICRVTIDKYECSFY